MEMAEDPHAWKSGSALQVVKREVRKTDSGTERGYHRRVVSASGIRTGSSGAEIRSGQASGGSGKMVHGCRHAEGSIRISGARSEKSLESASV